MATNKIFIPYYISNNTGAPAQVLPRVFFYNGLKDSDPYWIQHWTTSSFGKTIIAEQYSAFPYFDNYSGQVTTTSSLSLLFLNEDPVYGTQIPSQSLYDSYWNKYVDLLYNPRTRIIRLSAVLPFPIYNKLELNDIIQLRSNYYHLRAINDYNLKTGECRMELLGPLLEGSYDGRTTFDNTCEQAPTIYGSVLFDTSSQVVSFAITGSNCCNNPNYVTIKIDYSSGSCPATPTNTIYETVPNVNPINIDLRAALAGSPGVNCVTMSVANLCYGVPVTGSYALIFTGSVSGSYGNYQISASAQKNDCPTCQTGSIYTTVVPANTFSSSVSQPVAQAAAVAYLTSVSQSNATTYGSCSINYYYNSQISNSIQRNNCLTCETGSFVTYTIPASQSQYTSTCSLAEAQNSASTYYNSTSQSYANTYGTCSYWTYYSTAISASVQKNDCTGCQTGSFSTIRLAASYSANTCSQANAQATAQAYFNSISQSQANLSGSCITNTYYSTAISASVYKNDCDFDQTGSYQTILLPASSSVNTCSQALAQTEAQTYFNSISQSQANASGSCGPHYYTNLTYNYQTDVIDTSNYPLSISVLNTGSQFAPVNNPPAENDSKWLTLRFLSSSQVTASVGGGLTYTVTMPTYLYSSMWIKVRDKNGNKVHFTGTPGNGTSFMYTGSSAVGGNKQVMLESKPKLYNNYTQSLGLNYDVPFEFIYQATSSIKPVTASYIYTSSATFPSISDTKWKQFNYWTTSSILSNSEDLCIIEGVTYKDKDKGTYVSQSNYYYFKWNLNNGSQWTPSLVDVATSDTSAWITASISSGSGIIRMAVTNPTASDANSLVINVQ